MENLYAIYASENLKRIFIDRVLDGGVETLAVESSPILFCDRRREGGPWAPSQEFPFCWTVVMNKNICMKF